VSILGEVNMHTSGTEFYGSSSNFVLLSQLFSRAQSATLIKQPNQTGTNGELSLQDTDAYNNISPGKSHIGDGGKRSLFGEATESSKGGTKHMTSNPLSIVNLLYNENIPSTPPKTPSEVYVASPYGGMKLTPLSILSDDQARRSQVGNEQNSSNQSIRQNNAHRQQEEEEDNPSITMIGSARTTSFPAINELVRAPDSISQSVTFWSEGWQLEKELLRIYFANLHHLHPMLCPRTFTTKCESQIWVNPAPTNIPRTQSKFFALYNAMMAVGALISGPEISQMLQDIQLLVMEDGQAKEVSNSYTCLEAAKIFFQRSKTLLGDVFEVCCLESVQSLFLLVGLPERTYSLMDVFISSLTANSCESSHFTARTRSSLTVATCIVVWL
jgi:Fungal specific transcription factor domain